MIHRPGDVGFDTNRNTSGAATQLRAFGFTFGVRYVCQENTATDRKIIRRPEYETLVAAGIEPWLVSEWYTPSDSATGTPSPFRYGRSIPELYRAADEDCAVAFKLAGDCGHTGLILHAVDWDATGNGTAPDMAIYLDRCRANQARTTHPIGVYCGGRMLRYLIDRAGWPSDGVIWWQASAWSSRFPEDEAHVLQTQQFSVGGITVDLNTVYRTFDVGDLPADGGGSDDMAELVLVKFGGSDALFRATAYTNASGTFPLLSTVEWLSPGVAAAYGPHCRTIDVDPAAVGNLTCIGPAPAGMVFFRIIDPSDGLAGPPGPAGPPGLPGHDGAPGASATQVIDEMTRRLSNG